MAISRINPESMQTELRPKDIFSLHERFAITPPFNRPRIVYIDSGDNPLPYYTPIYVSPGKVIPAMSISEISVTAPPFIRVE